MWSAAPPRAWSAPATPEAGEDTKLAGEEQAALDQQLRAAAWANDVARARRLIGHGADVNAKDDTEQSAYLWRPARAISTCCG